MRFRKLWKLWKKEILKIGRGEMICYSNKMTIQNTYRDCVAIVYKTKSWQQRFKSSSSDYLALYAILFPGTLI